MAVRIMADSICSPSLKVTDELGIIIVPINIHFGETVYKDLTEIETGRFHRLSG